MPETRQLRCWDYFSCTNSDCPAYGNVTHACWTLDTCAYCHGKLSHMENKELACAVCRVFEECTDADAVKAFLHKHYYSMLLREQVAEQTVTSLNAGISRISEVVGLLCKGDPSVRVVAFSDNKALRALEEGVNKLAESLMERIDESHEMAIGICEHFDTLNTIAAGDLTVRAREDSPNELIAQLGVLINKETVSLLSIIQQLRVIDEKLTFSYHQMRDIVDFLPDATFVVDQHGKIIAWNKAIEEITGYSKKEMLGRDNRAYAIPFYGERRPILLDYLDQDTSVIEMYYSYVKRVDNTLYAEAHIPAFRDRGEIYFWVTAAPLIDQYGTRIGAVESVRDISDFRKSENSRAQLEAQLRQSQKMEAIGLLAGGIAHDFNNLLTAIIGYTTLIQLKTADDADIQHFVSQINISTGRATKLIQDLLAFSRKRVLNPQAAELNTIILNIRGLLARLLTEDINFSLLLSEETLMAVVDRGMIEQVLLNLVANARDAMPQGGVVTIRTGIAGQETMPPDACIRTDVRYALIEVADTGIGMDESTREKIFEPFFTTKEPGKGSGLGLSTVFGIIAQHEGCITVSTSPGHGTTFSLFLPLFDQDLSGDLNPQDHEAAPPLIPGTETILVAEDSDEILQVTTDILTEAGYQVITATDGAEALALFGKHHDRITLVLLDAIMPVMNGRELYDAMRQVNPGLRCLFTSGYAADVIQRQAGIDAAVDFIPKPCRPHQLLGKIREILDRPSP